MKKATILLLMMALSAVTFSQQIESSQPKVATDYLQKSKNQKKIGRILLIGGGVLMITSFVIPRGDLTYDGICIGGYCDDEYKNDNLKTAIFLTGAASALASIPFFISSKKNKKKSINASAFLKMDRVPVLNELAQKNPHIPSLGLRIKI